MVDAVRDRGSSIAVVGALLVVAGGLLPWVASGDVWRNSYAMVRSADQLGLLEGYTRLLATAWYMIPFVCSLVLVGAAFRWPRLLEVAAVTSGVLVAGVSGLALTSELRTGPGPWLAALGAVVLVAGAVLSAYDRRNPNPMSPGTGDGGIS